MLGTVHCADTPQLPQSISPVEEFVRHAGCFWGSSPVGLMFDAIEPGAVAAVVAEPQDFDVIGGGGVLILKDSVSPTLTLIEVA